MAKVYKPGKRVVVLALGIGITEAFTTCREQLRKLPQCIVTLVQAVRLKDELVMQDQVQALAEEFKGRFDVVRAASGEKVPGWLHGRVDAKAVVDIIGHDVPMCDVKLLVVGTKPMMKSVWADLSNAGFDYEKYALVRKHKPPYF